MQNLAKGKQKVLVIGLGYVGVPLMKSILESNKYLVSGFDLSSEVIDLLSQDSGEFKGVDLKELNSYGPNFFSDITKLTDYDVFVICVPTPLLDGGPDLSMICKSGELIAKIIKI